MFTLLYGDDLVSSRRALEEIKLGHKESEILVLDGEKVSLSELKQALESSSIFASSRLVILENFFSSHPSKEKLSYLSSGEFSPDLVLWEGKQISPGLIIRLGPGIEVRVFKLPAVVFQFLDKYSPKNKKASLMALEKALKSSAPSLVFYLLARQVRNLLLVKSDGRLAGTPIWKLKKLQNQAKQFSLDSLQKIYQKLLWIDFAQKKGEERFNLAGELQMLILEID